MIPRHAANFIKKLIPQYPVLALTGPRQSGKTTLARAIFADFPYVSLENPQTLVLAKSDPVGFLEQYREGALFDEAQRFPELFSYLQQILDEGPKHCRYVLTGSQQVGLRSQITQSLAGRAANVTLLPFQISELFSLPEAVPDLESIMIQGMYPPIHDRKLDPAVWLANYIQNYVEKDVRQLTKVQDLLQFQIFLKMCASRAGQLLNLSALAADCGVAVNTAKHWISILEASYIIFLLPPFFKNFGKRLVKTPKLYFYDTGLLCYLLNIQSPEKIFYSPEKGALFENFVLSEYRKNMYHLGLHEQHYFWRDRSGLEIDFIRETAEGPKVYEIKSGKTLQPDYFKNLEKWNAISGNSPSDSHLIHAGKEEWKYHSISAIPWKRIAPPALPIDY